MQKPYELLGVGLLLAVTMIKVFPSNAAEGILGFQLSGNNGRVQVVGGDEDDWWIETSTNLFSWTTLTNLGTVLSGNTLNAPWRMLGVSTNSTRFFRARQTAGLYDPTLFRSINLYFTTSGTTLSNQLAGGRAYETNVLCWLSLDNGATNLGVGARYKGNTSFGLSGTKKSINLELDYTNSEFRLMGYKTVNLNNAAGDDTIMREPLYFYVMNKYTPCPEAAMCRVYINGSLWGVYALVEQENSDLIKEWFPSSDGDRWRAPNSAVGGFPSSNSAFAYFGTNWFNYTNDYELKTDNSATNIAYQRLANAITILNKTAADQLRDKLEDYFGVDSWLWFLAIENIFTDDDSYWNKGADYGFYYEVESGRMFPVEHDGNEAFTARDSSLSPLVGYNATGGAATLSNRPLIYRLLAIPELRQRYLAHLRTVVQEYYNPTNLTPVINQFHALSIAGILLDPNKGFTMSAYTNDLVALKTYVTNRYNYLISHSELTPARPNIVAVTGPATTVTSTNIPFITANVLANGSSGVGSVWLYYRGKSYGRFAVTRMSDDGNHGDDAANDGIYGAATTNYPAGTKVRYYVEARATNSAQAASFSPARAEHETFKYTVTLASATNSPVILNEFVADNKTGITNQLGEHADWIELRNLTDSAVDLGGWYLSDDSTAPTKWQFPSNTHIAANGYLLVWADDNTSLTTATNLHAGFKLSKSGEQIVLTGPASANYPLYDTITFGSQTTDKSFGRSPANDDAWIIQSPTPGMANQ